MTVDDYEEKRPDPDALLAKMREETGGKLTMFLGPIAGVGKTYAMLEAARERRSEGVDVVVGIVETHGRRETEELLTGLTVIPMKSLQYKGHHFDEMDLDAILQRKPDLVLVDELAHTNLPGSRHPRRYLDVEELLQAGIDVYTTLNIQHIESLNSAVAGITGIEVHETVPDQFLEKAQFLRSIDIPAEELVKRLKDGKVYVPETVERALRNFFRTGNINALRELALRYAAQRVDEEVTRYRTEHDIQAPWHAGELVLACTSTNPFGATVLRVAKRLATELHAHLIVVNVGSGRNRSELDEQNLANNLRLAEEMGAEVVTLNGKDIPGELLELAFERNVTEIVVGKPLKRKVRDWFGPSIVDRIINGSRGISVHIVPGDPQAVVRQPRIRPRLKAPAVRYVEALALVALVTALAKALGPVLQIEQGGTVSDLTNIAMLFLLPVVVAGVRGGFGPSALAALVGVVAFDVFFVPPVGTITVSDLQYLITFAVFLAVGLTVATIAGRLRYRAEDALKKEAATNAVYRMAKELAAVTDEETIAQIVANHAAKHVGGDTVVYLPRGDGTLAVAGRSNETARGLESENEQAVAAWTFLHSDVAGRGTNTIPGAKCIYVPLVSERRTFGALAVCLAEKEASLEPRKRTMLEAVAGLAALSLSRSELVRFGQQVLYLEQSEQLRTALLNSVSHDLRTPLSTITGAVTSLLEAESRFSPEERRALLHDIKSGASRMDRTTGNLLAMARLESGMATLDRDWCDLEDVIGVVLKQYEHELAGRNVQLEIPDDVPLVMADYGLLEQVMANLIDNAIKYSQEGSEIKVILGYSGGQLRVSVADRGIGVPAVDTEMIFDKFYRLNRDSGIGGTGLGLSISKGIIEAHGGRIWAGSREGGGTVFTFTLPLEQGSMIG
ncbi:MAG: sensor histidine kinase KdpD [Actinomycetota bacterium]